MRPFAPLRVTIQVKRCWTHYHALFKTDGFSARYPMPLSYDTFNHTADLGVEVHGGDRVELFSNAGLALFDLIIGIDAIEAKSDVPVTVEGTDCEDLMINWLRELLYLHQVKGYLFSSFVIHELDEGLIKASVRGELFDKRRHKLVREIKAVTYHQIKVAHEQGGWVARMVFDI